MAAKVQQRNESVNRQCAELQTKLSADGFESVVLKGQGVAALYKLGEDSLGQRDSASESGNISKFSTLSYQLGLLRQSGDIDVWLSGSRKKIRNYINANYKVDEMIYNHAHVQVFEDTEVEVHFTPSWLYNPYRNRRLQAWFKRYRIKDFDIDDGFRRPSLDFNAVYLLLHNYRHLMHEGLGLRQVMDYYFVMKSAFVDCKEGMALDIRRRSALEVVESLGMTNFAEAMMWVLQYVFAMPMTSMPWVPNEKRGRRLLTEIMHGGNMGRGDDRTGKATTRLGYFAEHVRRQWCFMQDYSEEVLWSPLWKTWHFVMRKLGKI